jgi:hypothetical protein
MKAKVTINITYDVSSPEEIQESFQSAASHLALNGLMSPDEPESDTKCWVVVYEHRHGVDAWPVFAAEEPSEEELIASLDEWEPDRGETIEVVGPWDLSGTPCASQPEEDEKE